nr:MAG TPA: hypothetical protein [Caudoviricetes sp.]
MADHATVLEVAVTLGRPITDPEEQKQITNWIEKVERIIAARLGDLHRLDPAILSDVITEVVARRVRNPDGKRNERIDDYSYTLEAAAASAELALTEAEWARLSEDGGTAGAWLPIATPNPWYGGHDRNAPLERSGWA